jgi:hypothetical protein
MTALIVTSIICGTVLVLALLVVRELRWHFPKVTAGSSSEKIAALEERIDHVAEQMSAHALALGLKDLK